MNALEHSRATSAKIAPQREVLMHRITIATVTNERTREPKKTAR